MLIICQSYCEIDIVQLLAIYQESIELNMETEQKSRFEVEEDFCEYLREIFFNDAGAICAIWVHDGQYVSALRLETFQDGYLVSGLETNPQARRKGFGRNLLRAVIAYVREKESCIVYAHIDKRNRGSYALHTECGFEQILDYGRLLDGSFSYQYRTLCISV